MTKICSKCKEEKDIDEFNLDSSTKDGHRFWCKECISVKGKKYRQTHKKEIAEYFKAHKEKIAERKARYYQAHKEEICKTQARYYQAHKEEIDKVNKRYNQTHKKECSENTKQYRRKAVKELKNVYIKNLIIQNTELQAKDIPSEMVDFYRTMIFIHRKIKKYKQGATL